MSDIRITMVDTIRRLREVGFRVSNATFPAMVDSGVLPFAKVVQVSPRTGRRTYCILRKDLEDWIKDQTQEVQP